MSKIIFKDVPISDNAVRLKKATIEEVVATQEAVSCSGSSALTCVVTIQEAAQRYVLGEYR